MTLNKYKLSEYKPDKTEQIQCKKLNFAPFEQLYY